LIDKASANDEAIAESLREAKLIYLLGGFTHYLAQTLTPLAGAHAGPLGKAISYQLSTRAPAGSIPRTRAVGG
jgi:hypothetical protein